MTAGPSTSQRRRIERLESQTKQLETIIRNLSGRPQTTVDPQDEWLAVTVDAEGTEGESIYPTGGGPGVPKFPIRFLDATFTATPGREALRTILRGDQNAPYDQIAASITGVWLPPGSLVKALWQRPTSGITAGDDDAGEWFIEPYSPAGRVGFLMTGPRLRLRHPNGVRYGTATATVTWIAGDVPVNVGESFTVHFSGTRWLEAVKNCEGFADYFTSYSVPPSEENPSGIVAEDIFIVTECQGLPAIVAAITEEDRNRLTPDQDVEAHSVASYGHAQDDLPIELWEGQLASGQCAGSAVWADTVTGTPRWVQVVPCAPGCQSQTNPNDGPWPTVAQPLPDVSYPCVGEGGDAPRFYVQFPQLKFPRSKKGAEVLAYLDNALWSDNPADMRYIVHVAQELQDEISGTLPSDVCGTDFNVSSVRHDTDWPHNQAIPASMFPLSIKNAGERTHHGQAGYKWAATWSEPEQRYVCDDMKKVVVTVPINMTQETDDETGCVTISWQNQEIAIEKCKEPVEGGSYSYKTALVQRLKRAYIDPGQTGSGSGVQCDPKLKLEFYQETAYVTCASDSSLVTEEVDLAVDDFVIDVADDGTCIYQTKQKRIHLGNCGDELDSDVICTTDEQCEGSGSG